MKGTVKVENLKIFAYHGCMAEEEIIGSDYVVNITASCTMSEKAFADQKIKINKFGGREKILSLGDFGYSPAPVGNTKN